MGQNNRFIGKRVLLGVTGSIAAYKAVDILRRLTELGAEVRVAMTDSASRFISPLTFEVLSGRPVLLDEYREPNGTAIAHIDITEGLDAALIAPATANSIGKMAAGIADNALTSAVLALGCPLLVAPAMNDRMFRNDLVQRNIRTLQEAGVRFIEPGIGSLACGTIGKGRLADIDQIINELSALLAPQDLAGKTLLVTAGPTREHVDAVRFISNPSTGRMGYALAAAARERGAEVVLITGPSQLVPPQGVTVIPVVSAFDMRSAVLANVERSHAVIMAAAVSDFRPVQASTRKIKKEAAESTIALERTEDILQELGAAANGRRLLVGFAAETDDVEQNALKKLKEKNLDLIVVNDLLKTGSGFGTDTNAVVLMKRDGTRIEVPTQLKTEIARRIMDSIVELMRKNK